MGWAWLLFIFVSPVPGIWQKKFKVDLLGNEGAVSKGFQGSKTALLLSVLAASKGFPDDLQCGQETRAQEIAAG